MNTEPIGFKEDTDFQLKKDILLECIGTSDNLEFELIPGEVLSFMVFQAMDKYAAERSKKMAVALQNLTKKLHDGGYFQASEEYRDALEVLKEAGLNP